jgi:mono/diheme cytochrome c family protein
MRNRDVRAATTALLLVATALWLQACVPGAGSTQAQVAFVKGAEVYQTHCANCHGMVGEGLGELIPPIARADYVRNHAQLLPCIIRFGVDSAITVNCKRYTQPMAGLDTLAPSEIAQVLTFIRNQWGNRAAADTFVHVTETEVISALKRCGK